MKFLHDDSGAITTDFAIVAAAVIGLGAAVVASIATGVTDLGN